MLLADSNNKYVDLNKENSNLKEELKNKEMLLADSNNKYVDLNKSYLKLKEDFEKNANGLIKVK